MKKVIFFASLFIWSLACQAQDISEKEVPSVVMNGFQQQFPQADDVEWEKEDDQLAVEFEIGKDDHKAWFDPSGKIVRHGVELEKKTIPETVKTAVKRDFAGYDVEEVFLIGTAKPYSYVVELEKGKEELTVFYDENGTKK